MKHTVKIHKLSLPSSYHLKENLGIGFILYLGGTRGISATMWVAPVLAHCTGWGTSTCSCMNLNFFNLITCWNLGTWANPLQSLGCQLPSLESQPLLSANPFVSCLPSLAEQPGWCFLGSMPVDSHQGCFHLYTVVFLAPSLLPLLLAEDLCGGVQHHVGQGGVGRGGAVRTCKAG